MITEDQIVREIFKKSNTKVAMKDIDIIVRDCVDVIRSHLKKGEQVYLADFGTLSPTKNIKQSFVEYSQVANKK